MKRGWVVRIDEARCIGCAQCLPACPVDAIVGAAGWMHTVIATQCIGCDLCLPPCPVDCIERIVAPRAWLASDAVLARRNATRRRHRLQVEHSAQPLPDRESRRAAVNAALARTRHRNKSKPT